MARPSRRSPRAHVVSGEWPEAQLDGDPAANAAQGFVARLAVAVGELSLRGVEAATGVDHDTVARILRGDTWPDIATVAHLEHGLNVDLWPGRMLPETETPGRDP
ncbi:MAG: helix-turn-helix transcriptional regulator [Aquihabitans sp.]